MDARKWYQRKKVQATLAAIALAVATKYFGMPADAVEQVLNALMVYVVGQGVADIGKES